jgi:NDP-sugar pyrophosphorylase family protein
MQAVILAAGQGKRLRPLTNDKPKPMVELIGKPILEHTIDFLPDDVDQLFVVVGYCAESIRAHFGASWKGRAIRYVEQPEPFGTAHALFLTKPHLKEERFLLVNGDNINDLGKAGVSLTHEYVLFAVEHETPQYFGVIETNEDGTLARIVEKPEKPTTNLVSTGSMILSPGIFDTTPVLLEGRNEYYIPSLLMQVMERGSPIHVVRQAFWVAVDRPEDIPKAEAALLKKLGK